MTDFEELLEDLDRPALLALRDQVDQMLAQLEREQGQRNDLTSGNIAGSSEYRQALEETATSRQAALGGSQDERANMPPKSSPAGAEGRGWVELKMIGKWGPYAYLRWHEGGRKRSKYLGKVKG
jgi:hypothetical protein